MDTPADVILHLAHAGVSLVVDARFGRLPSIVHWGAQLGDLGDAALVGLSDASVPVVGSNNVDTPPRVALLPEHHTGWTGRPGLSGSASGRGWSPRFLTRAIEFDGTAGRGCGLGGRGSRGLPRGG
jgi:alpha-galactosidase